MATAKTLLSAPESYVWSFPGCPVKVHLALQVVERLSRRQEAWTSTAEEGLLFGAARDGGTEILTFEPAVNSSVRGMVAALPAEDKRSLMGYYRIEEAEAFQLTPEDARLADECFPRPEQVFLMIRHKGPGTPSATFFFHDGPRMVDFAFLEFSFDPARMAMDERDRIQRSKQAAYGPVALPPAPPAKPAPETRRRKSRIWGVVIGTAGAAFVFVMGMSFTNRVVWERTAPPPPAASVAPVPKPSIGLHATRQNNDLDLTWNRDSSVIAAAVSGVMTIQDGDSKREVTLDGAQLRGGSLLYSPMSDQILMRLAVTMPAETIAETVTVILPKVGQPRNVPVIVPKAPVESRAAQPEPKPQPLPTSPAPVRVAKPFTPPELAKVGSSARPRDVDDAPALRFNPAVPAGLPAALPAQNSLPRAPVTPPQQPITPPATSNPLPQAAPAIVTYEPAVAVVKTSPKFPAELRNIAIRPTVVEVMVQVDKNGKVTKADAVPQKNVSVFLLNAAVDAARLWKFRPAVRNGQPVATQSTLQFLFTR